MSVFAPVAIVVLLNAGNAETPANTGTISNARDVVTMFESWAAAQACSNAIVRQVYI